MNYQIVLEVSHDTLIIGDTKIPRQTTTIAAHGPRMGGKYQITNPEQAAEILRAVLVDVFKEYVTGGDR